MQYIAFDAHKLYTLASVARPDGTMAGRLLDTADHCTSASFLARFAGATVRCYGIGAGHGTATTSCRLEGVRDASPRPRGTHAKASEPTPNGYRLEVACACRVVFERWMVPDDAAIEMALLARWN